MIDQLTPAELLEFETVVEACEKLQTEQERQQGINAVANPAVRALLQVAFEEPVSARALRPGVRLGEYELVERLGGGGFGEVWRAKRAAAGNESVAIKVLRGDHKRGSASARIVQLFQDEIARHQTMAHEGIVKLLSAGSVVLPGATQPTAYLAMEFWPGLPLPDACRGHSVEEKVRCLIRVCEAVQYAHRQGLMHLDLKPENILVVDDQGRLLPKLLDFGVARGFRADRPLDRARFGAGTLPYKAPEQIEPALGGEDFRTDVHALGTLLFQALTDRLPYPVQEGTAEELKSLILQRPRLSLSALDNTMDPALDQICARATAIERSRRYDSPERLADALRQWLLRERTGVWKPVLVVGCCVLLVSGIILLPGLRKPKSIGQEKSSDQQKPATLWRWVPIKFTGSDSAATPFWTDIAWEGNQGWLCGILDHNETPGMNVGRGILVHTTDGGVTWQEVPRNNFTMDRGTLGCFEDKTWDGVGPLYFVGTRAQLDASGHWLTNGWAAGVTGVYFSDDPTSADAQWKRSTPLPDTVDCYSNFGNLLDVDNYNEVYAVGWQGIAHWERGQWTVQFPTHSFTISSIFVVDRGHREAWATSNGGSVVPYGGATDYGALFHYAWPGTNWERVGLPGIDIRPRQGLSAIDHHRSLGELFAVGSSGLMLHGLIQGTNWVWEKLPSVTSQALNSLATDRNLALWVVGNDGLIMRSRDDGKSWTELPCFDEKGDRIRRPFRRIRFFMDRDQGWILGYNVVLRYDVP